MDDPLSFSTSLCPDLLEELDDGERNADSQLNTVGFIQWSSVTNFYDKQRHPKIG